MTILAVDDEPIVLSVLINAIREAEPGCEVRGFESPEEALAELAEHGFRPEVAFLDIEMYGMLGLELAQRVKEISRDTKIIFVTGFSQYALEAYSIHARGYLMKPATAAKVRNELDCLQADLPCTPTQHHLRVQCFGNFEVFLDGAPFRFERNKTKELFAYLVDRKGAAVTTGELCTVLWEDGGNSESQRNQLRVLISDLSRSLATAGIPHVLRKSRNSFSVAVNELDCDLFSFLRQETDALNAYRGEYMVQYSWAELTLGSLG